MTELVTELMQQLLLGLAGQLQRMDADPYLARPIPLVYAGGLTILRGFRPLMINALRRLDLPIPIGEVRGAAPPDSAVCRGCLIWAELEGEDQRRGIRVA